MFFTCQEFLKNNKNKNWGSNFGVRRETTFAIICIVFDWMTETQTHTTHTAFYKVDGKWELGKEMETFWKGHYTLKDTRLRGVAVKGCVCVCV